MQNNKTDLINILLLLLIFFLFVNKATAQEDHSFYSKAFNSERFYRIYLPSDYYKNSDKRYPVVYYFHGWSGRYKWDAYSIAYDPYHNGKARKKPPFVMEWKDYVKNHDVIIVTWDGYEPKFQPGKYEREGIKYGRCAPYDYLRAHNLNREIRGWDYKLYFRDLVAHIDSTYRTYANRNNRAITGLSMGGLMANYIAGQNKDYVCSISSFCPADNYPLFGVKGKQVVFPILEMYRSLKGIPVRLTMTDGDWLKYNDLAMNQLWSAADLTHFEFHVAHFRDHYAADTEEQLDFHMKHFSNSDETNIPKSWSYVAPGFTTFKTFDYEVAIDRDEPALTMLDKFNDKKIKIISRTFIPDGKIIKNESIKLKTDLPFNNYKIIAYNLLHNSFSVLKGEEKDGKLQITLNGGGNVVGINGAKLGDAPNIFILDKHNRDYLYFEVDKEYELDLNIVNLGNRDADNLEITASTLHPYLTFTQNKIKCKKLKVGTVLKSDNKIKLKFTHYKEELINGTLFFETKINGEVVDTQKVIFFETPKSQYVNSNDVLVLDGRTVKNVPVFHQERNTIQRDSLSGGKGNGNGIPEKGEDVIIYIRIPKGISCRDTNSFHKTYLINQFDDKSVKVNKLKYDEKIHQAGATSVSSIISISDNTPKLHQFDLCFRIESLYNDYDDQTAINPVYTFKYDYRRIKLNR